MALKMKEMYLKNAITTTKQQAAAPADFKITQASYTESLATASTSTNINQAILPEDCEYVESIKGT